MSKSFFVRSMIGCMLLGFISGCTDTSQPDYASLGLVEISGTVTMDDQPLPKVAVFFHDRPNRVYSYGVTDDNGRYTLMFDSRKTGVMPGEKEIEITSTKNPAASPVDSTAESGSEETAAEETEGNETEDGEVKAGARRSEIIPAKYNTASTLKFTVTESNSAVDFKLESK